VVGYYEHSNETSGSMKVANFLTIWATVSFYFMKLHIVIVTVYNNTFMLIMLWVLQLVIKAVTYELYGKNWRSLRLII
jgi:hypothetical protein